MSRFLARARVAASRDASSSRASPPLARARRSRARRAARTRVRTVRASSDGAAARDARDATTRWLTDVIIGMNLCPFARASMAKTFAIEVVRGDGGGGGYGDVLARETRRLAACARDESATTLIVFENGWNDDWEGFMRGPVREAEDACEATTGGETVTVVPFHPLAAFDGESEASNYTSRSPFPTVHLLRACDIERAEDTWYRLEEREDIRERNAEYLEALGVRELRRLWARIVANDAPT